jgi:hypothetical protein
LSRRAASLLGAALLSLGATTCYDPVHLDEVKQLGDEAPGVPRGPSHRPGQPCTVCHGGYGPADVEFSVAGTLFTVRKSSTPLANGTVTVTDPLGSTMKFTSNEVGNFYVPRKDWDPAFPMTVFIESDNVKATMQTSLGREGGCAWCHRDDGDVSHMPGVYLKVAP